MGLDHVKKMFENDHSNGQFVKNAFSAYGLVTAFVSDSTE